MSVNKKTAGFKVPKNVSAKVTQANPISGMQYAVLATAANVEIDSLTVNCTWTVQPDPLELWVTIDGVQWNFSQANPISTQNYIPFVYVNVDETVAHVMNATAGSLNDYLNFMAGFFRGRSIQVLMEVTGGTVSAIEGIIKYHKW